MAVENMFSSEQGEYQPDVQSQTILRAVRWASSRTKNPSGIPETYYDPQLGEIMVWDGRTFKPQTEEQDQAKRYSS